MQGVELFFYSSLSLLSPFPKPPPPSFLFPPILLRSHLSLSKRSPIPHCISRFPNSKQHQPDDDLQLEEESDAEDYTRIDVDELEEEAKSAAREYSSSLSRQLIIGESSG